MSLLGMLRTTCTIQRRDVQKGTAGGQTMAWDAVVTDEPCDIQSSSGRVFMDYQVRGLRVTHTVYFSRDVGIFATDRIISGTRVFKVQGYTPPSPSYTQWPAKADVEEEPIVP